MAGKFKLGVYIPNFRIILAGVIHYNSCSWKELEFGIYVTLLQIVKIAAGYFKMGHLAQIVITPQGIIH